MRPRVGVWDTGLTESEENEHAGELHFWFGRMMIMGIQESEGVVNEF